MTPKDKTLKNRHDFASISISLTPPEDILRWSFGEVKRAETINYRTQKPEKDGLFDEKIFGPETDFSCGCGKYKGIQYNGITCEKCHVEITRSAVRRERMGHIELATPIAHVWYLKKVSSKISIILGISATLVQKVSQFAAYIIMSINEDKISETKKKLEAEYKEEYAAVNAKQTKATLKEFFDQKMALLNSLVEGEIINEIEYDQLSNEFSSLFSASTGGDAIYKVLKNLDLKKLEKQLKKEIEDTTETKKLKLNKQLSLVRSFLNSGLRPEWMFMIRLPVIPPGLRPMVALDGGRYASSDLNDLYRHIINRNNRLKRLIDIKAPEIILRNEKRLLQESVDALLDGTVKSSATSALNRTQAKRPKKSIAEYLTGKQGYFRANLLGKRVDYSGRSVIVVGPHLKIDECGVPKGMALELFRPFVISELLKKELAHNIRTANRLIDDRDVEVWDILDQVIKGKYVLLNRQPTLHRLNIQAFKPILIEGKAIEISPLICPAFNADFDGDQMGIHLPLSDEAQREAREVIASTKNVVKPATGEIITSPSQLDIRLGCYWATVIKEGANGENSYFAKPNKAISAYEYGKLNLRAKIYVLPTDSPKYAGFNNKYFETTVGRLLFNAILPKNIPYVNEQVTGKSIDRVVENLTDELGMDRAVPYFDDLKDFGFAMATLSGTTIAMSDLIVPEGSSKKINDGLEKSKEIFDNYNKGLISRAERKRKNIELWHGINEDLSNSLKENMPKDNPFSNIIQSGARGSAAQLSSMVNMKGVIANAKGDTVEHPVLSSSKQGLNPIEYFISAYGARKGLSDTALKTAKAGYLTRQLFDVAQEINITSNDCKVSRGFNLYRKTASGIEISFGKRIKGRFTAEDVTSKNGAVIVKSNKNIDSEIAAKIENDKSIEFVKVRSPLACNLVDGVCRKCYGRDLSTGEIIELGEAIGTIAAQSIGEQGTQLTMRTFHTGGVASIGGDITTGLPRIEQIFGNRKSKSPAILSKTNGSVFKIEKQKELRESLITIRPDKNIDNKDMTYVIPQNRFIIVEEGDEVIKGQFLTDGSANLEEMLEYTSKKDTQEYIFAEVTKMYELQGVEVDPVYFEVLIRQMFTRFKVVDPGDSTYTTNDLIGLVEYHEINDELKESGGNKIKVLPLVSGIIKVSTSRDNWLSAASFENTTNVLINASVRGAIDTLDGLKENVIIGRLIPVGTGLVDSKKYNIIKDLLEDEE